MSPLATRKTLGLNIAEMARLLDVPRSTWNTWERGEAAPGRAALSLMALWVRLHDEWPEVYEELKSIKEHKMREQNQIVTPRSGLYLCRRTSTYYEKPCEESFRVRVENIDTRNCDDPKKIPANRGTDGDWYTYGKNHRVEGWKIRRDMEPKEEWAVEVSDIMDFVDKHGECVVSRDDAGFCTIEIYDTYRE